MKTCACALILFANSCQRKSGSVSDENSSSFSLGRCLVQIFRQKQDCYSLYVVRVSLYVFQCKIRCTESRLGTRTVVRFWTTQVIWLMVCEPRWKWAFSMVRNTLHFCAFHALSRSFVPVLSKCVPPTQWNHGNAPKRDRNGTAPWRELILPTGRETVLGNRTTYSKNPVVVKTYCLWHKHLENAIISGGDRARFFRKWVQTMLFSSMKYGVNGKTAGDLLAFRQQF